MVSSVNVMKLLLFIYTDPSTYFLVLESCKFDGSCILPCCRPVCFDKAYDKVGIAAQFCYLSYFVVFTIAGPR